MATTRSSLTDEKLITFAYKTACCVTKADSLNESTREGKIIYPGSHKGRTVTNMVVNGNKRRGKGGVGRRETCSVRCLILPGPRLLTGYLIRQATDSSRLRHICKPFRTEPRAARDKTTSVFSAKYTILQSKPFENQ